MQQETADSPTRSTLGYAAQDLNRVTKTAGTTSRGLSIRRLNIMRIGYGVMGVGIAVRNWPLLVNRSEPWPLYEGVTKYMLVAMGLLALLGLRYPVRMLPILLFESAWKLLWLGAIAVPLWIRDDMSAATAEVAGAALWVVIIIAVIPWRFVFTQYVAPRGDAWRQRSVTDNGDVGEDWL